MYVSLWHCVYLMHLWVLNICHQALLNFLWQFIKLTTTNWFQLKLGQAKIFFFLNFLQSLNFMNELLHLHSFRTFGHLWCKRRCRTHFMTAVLINHWTWMWFSNFYIILSEHKMVRLHSSAKPALIALRSCIVHVTQFIFMEYHDQSQKIIKEIHYITKLILILMSFYRDLHVHVIVDSKEI